MKEVTGLPRDGRGAVVTVGTFDGLHRGHHQVLREIVGRAERSGRRSVLVTFHPHPLRIIRPEDAPPLLTTTTEKKEILAACGLEYAVFLEFTQALQQYSARRFVTEILLGRLGMEELVIGYDHGFGRDREGTVDRLREIGRELGFAVDVVEAVQASEAPISATGIRRALASGNVVAAAHGLGRPYALEGTVVRGAQRGRKLGFPTANISVADADKLLPREGVYAVRGIVEGEPIPGLLHLGPRPTYQGLPPSIELHLLDWAGDLYGARVRVEFCAWLREILPFASEGALVEQMKRDRELGWKVLRGQAGPCACL